MQNNFFWWFVLMGILKNLLEQKLTVSISRIAMSVENKWFYYNDEYEQWLR